MNSETSLAVQARLAAQFVSDAWPGLQSAAKSVVGELPAAPKLVLLCGCGDSHHAADSLSYALRGWTGLQSWGVPAMRAARYLVPELQSGPAGRLLIGISASGETARTLEAVELARQAGMASLAITCGAESSLSRAADHRLVVELPDFPTGPGLLSYLGSLLAGCALACALAPRSLAAHVDSAMGELGSLLSEALATRWPVGRETVERIAADLPVTYLGSGPAYGAAMFAAAKLIESAGRLAWAQDTEEWAHLEYFADPAELPVWLLTASGRAAVREQEVLDAADRIGRQVIVSRWAGGQEWPSWLRESLSPIGLWIEPVALADELMARSGATPFRGFGGGRSQEEGGGASRIRSSQRLTNLKELSEFQSEN